MHVDKPEENEETTAVRTSAQVEDVEAKRQKVEEYFKKKLLESKDAYYDSLAELFFLENGGNMMDFIAWKKKRTPLYLSFLKQHELVELNEDSGVSNTTPVESVPEPTAIPESQTEIKPASNSISEDAPSPSIPSSTPATPVSNLETPTPATPVPSTPAVAPSGLPGRSLAFRTPGTNPVGRPASVLTPEQIVEKAKQEAFVMQRISELQRDGLWSEKRLPKVQEPARPKCHWDYLLEEMVWLAADFAQERKWKKAAARKCARMVQKHFQEKAAAALKAEREEELRLKKIANFMAKEIKNFWSNAEKFLEYKQNTLLEEKRKQALDQTLNFIVHETEKYSSWLAEGMSGSAKPNEVSASQEPDDRLSDGEFEPASSSSDDEETIAKAEEEEQKEEGGSNKNELDALLRESDLPLEDLLNELPPGYLDEIEGPSAQKPKALKEEELSDEDFQADSDDEPDDEATLEEEEAKGSEQDHQAELAELEEEGNLPLEKLLEKYGQKAADFDQDTKGSSGGETDSDDDESIAAEDQDEEEEDEEEDEEENESNVEKSKDMGLASLFDDTSTSENPEATKSNLNDVAALAETFQPKGNTLASAQVHTKVPFLLKLPLREYQHVGLEWLATLYERKLNGILADEMGLGKTIQTIALLAWLACEKGIWGPHLIVVPTSVMLNWEMEIKKWCPGFKILTYYGSQKDRKLKRTGWTKPNAFHVCITSYKLVIQDHQAFRRKRWKYFILDEAQNIKNFKSQRWQLLLNFQSQRRLLLTGTPLQNNLMELWSLMHFLMPDVFESHKDFREWFSNPVTGMIEGSSDYNDSVIRRLHKVLRPFLLRRLKSEVEKQLPQKYEHVVMCRLSKRQRYLYDDFMSRAKTRETLSSGNLLSVINVLMQLRKVCNHPNLFEPRPTISPFQMEGLVYTTASCVLGALEFNPFKHVNLFTLNLLLADLELSLTAFAAHRVRRFQAAPSLIQEVDWSTNPPPRCPAGKIRLHVRASANVHPLAAAASAAAAGGVKPNPAMPVLGSLSANHLQSRLTGSPATGVTGLSAPQQPRLASPAPSLPGSAPQPSAAGTVPSQANIGILRSPAPGNNGLPHSSPVPGLIRGTTTGTAANVGGISSPATNGTVTGIRLASPATSTASQGAMTSLTVQLPQGGTTRLTLPTSIAQLVQPGGGNLVASIGGSGSRAQGAQLSLTSVMTSAGQRFVLTRNPAAVRSTAGTPVTPGTPTTLRGTAPTTPVSSRVSALQRSDAPAVTSPSASVKLENGPESLEPTRRRERHAWDKSVFRLPTLEDKRRQERREKLALLARLNKQRCTACPIYGADLIEAVEQVAKVPVSQSDPQQWQRSGTGAIHCSKAFQPYNRGEDFLTRSSALRGALYTPEERIEQLRDTLSRFVFCVPPVHAPSIQLHVSHPQPSLLWREKRNEALLRQELSSKCGVLHPVKSAMITQFPDPRLIQYDCGKLQTLSVLLRQLKAGKHRVLLFTQMTRMLDVLEAFLAHEGHLYLRLDGTTKVDQRQALMERFNADARIFAFILSTRSGGVGINLTGADTVVFYDSDWNPTMDAQAQDRCHRIGQTRDVHIYRLISERTIEENILKKANQKRLLGDIAIEGGNFTTAHLKKSTIQDLFEVDQNEADASKRMADVLDRPRASVGPAQEEESVETTTNTSTNTTREDKGALGAFETALASVEDESDVVAARTARAEAAAELAEFDESAPVTQGEDENGPELSKAEAGLQQLEHQLTPVERYAIRFMEICEDTWTAEQLKQAEAQIEEQKKAWELKRLAQRNASEQNLDEDDPASIVHYSRFDANQDWVWDEETMPVWCPPTPPLSENDVYVDHCLSYLYESTPMDESRLPPVTARRELKRPHPETSSVVKGEEGRRPLKIRKEESFYAPRSLFDRPSPALMKMRRDMKLQKGRGVVLSAIPGGSAVGSAGLVAPVGFKAQPYGLARSLGNEESENVPEWLIQEDMVLLQTVQNMLELPASLMVLTPAHTPNWDLVSDMVNSVSRTFRSPKQCRNRYLNVILPREEGKLVYEPSPKKVKKNKHPYRPSQGRSLRTAQLYSSDNNGSFTSLYMQRFQAIKSISIKKAPTSRSVLSSAAACNNLPSRSNSVSGSSTPSSQSSNGGVKQTLLLSEAGIQYETPLSPLQVAVARAERVAREKQKTATLALAAELAQQAPKPSVAASVSPAPSSSTPPTPRLSSPSPGASPLASALASQNTPGQSVLVSVSQTNASSPLASVVSLPGNVLQASGSGTTIRAQRPITTLAVSSAGGVGLLTVASSSGTYTTNTMNLTTSQSLGPGNVVSVSNLTAAQVQAAAQALASAGLTTQIIATTSAPRVAIATVQTLASTGVTTTTTTGATSKTFTPAQLQLLKQQALLRQQQQRLNAAAGNAQEGTKKPTTLAGSPAFLATATGNSPTKAAVAIGSGTLVTATPGRSLATLATSKAGATTLARTLVSEADMAALLRRQAQGGTSTLVKAVTGAQTGSTVTLPVSGVGLQVKGLVSGTASALGVKATPATQQQLRQLALQQQLLQRKAQQQKNAAVQGKGNVMTVSGQSLGMGTVQLVQPVNVTPATAAAGTATAGSTQGIGGPKAATLSTTVTMQQLQQVIRQVTGGGAQGQTQIVQQAVLAKPGSGGQTVQARVIPVNQQTLKQTMQDTPVVVKVVSAGQGTGPRMAVSNLNANSSAGGAQDGTAAGRSVPLSVSMPVPVSVAVGTNIASALAAGTLKVAAGTTAQQQALLSQVSAALQSGQPVSLAVRTGPVGGSPARLVAQTTASSSANQPPPPPPPEDPPT